MLNLVLIAVVMLGAAASYASQPPDALAVKEIAPGAWVHRGHYADLDDPRRGDSANVGFVVGSRCVAVIDTGGALETGRALKAAITGVTDRPVCYVVNTHVHFDHVLGNAAFAGDGVEFVGHENLVDAMAANREFFAEEFADELGDGGAANVVVPTIPVSGEHELDLGDRTLVVTAEATAHTNTDVTVYDPATGTLWAGDLLFVERMPIIDGSLKGWLAWIENARGRSVARAVPGHGPAHVPWPDGVDAEYAYLNTLLTEARVAIENGMFLEDALESLGREAAADWAVNDRHPRNVSRAYRELEWE